MGAMGPFAEIGFAEAQDPGLGDFSECLGDEGVFRTGGAAGVDQMEYDINIGEGFAGAVVELFDESGAAGVEEAGSIDEYDLAARMVDDAVKGVARRLGFRGDDGDLPANEGVEKGGFAGVGPADQGCEAGAETGWEIQRRRGRRRVRNVHGVWVGEKER